MKQTENVSSITVVHQYTGKSRVVDVVRVLKNCIEITLHDPARPTKLQYQPSKGYYEDWYSGYVYCAREIGVKK